MTTRLDGQVALVTGASRGIGRAIAEGLARAGATVMINFVQNQVAAKEVLEQIQAEGGQAVLCRFDVGDGDAVTTAVQEILERQGKIDILVNNAGMSINTLLVRLKADEWTQVLNANLTGVFLCTKAVTRSMMRQRSGRIINLTSVVAQAGNAGQAAYSAAKAGVIGFTKTMAKELASRSITVNAVAPGFIETDMTRSLPEEAKTGYLSRIPAGRWGTVEEVADVVAFLANPRAGYITGQVINVNGGMYM
jgi:3-oxoacyl-[acyl-carrier protein] reductase